MNRIRTFFALIGSPESVPPWTLTTALIVVTFAFAAMLIGAGAVLVWAGAQPYTALAGWTLGGLLVIVFVWQTRRGHWDAMRLVPSKTPILFVMFVAFGCALALDLLGLAVTGEFLPRPELLGLNPGALGVLEWGCAIAFLVIVQPVAEGLVFRGITLPALRSVLGAWGGLIAAVIVTGAFHLLVYPPNYNTASPITPVWYGLVMPMIEAAIYSAVRNASHSTRSAIAAQIAFGLFAVVKLLTLTGSA